MWLTVKLWQPMLLSILFLFLIVASHYNSAFAQSGCRSTGSKLIWHSNCEYANERASFTGGLANEIAVRKGRGEQSIELAEIVDSLRTRMSRIKPTHGIRLVIIFFASVFQMSTQYCFPLMPPSLSPVFSVHLSPSLGQEGLKEMIQWIHNLNSDIELSLETNLMQ